MEFLAFALFALVVVGFSTIMITAQSGVLLDKEAPAGGWNAPYHYPPKSVRVIVWAPKKSDNPRERLDGFVTVDGSLTGLDPQETRKRLRKGQLEDVIRDGYKAIIRI